MHPDTQQQIIDDKVTTYPFSEYADIFYQPVYVTTNEVLGRLGENYQDKETVNADLTALANAGFLHETRKMPNGVLTPAYQSTSRGQAMARTVVPASRLE